MSTATHAASGKLSFGGLLVRIVIIAVIWAVLVAGLMRYLGHVIPTEYQISEATQQQAEEDAKARANPAPAAAAPAPAIASAAASASAAKPAASAASAAPAAASASGSAAAPAAGSAAKAASDKKEPHDLLLAGYNRTALTNVAIFYSIVVSVLCVGAILLQIFKYRHVEEEEPAH